MEAHAIESTEARGVTTRSDGLQHRRERRSNDATTLRPSQQLTFHRATRNMTSKLMGKLKETLGNDARPAIPLARPEAASGSAPREIQSSPRVQFKGSRYVMCKTEDGQTARADSAASSTSTSPSTGASPPAKHDVLDAAHSPPSVLSQHLGPPTIEHKYPRDTDQSWLMGSWVGVGDESRVQTVLAVALGGTLAKAVWAAVGVGHCWW
ncbi:hypothetical protein MHUMG1_08180 [Metarhizium humberi]|uniref:Uncharacterized protein n=1 Tax=Metarhizium humberi TaxID=2596975 RepID=A0A9P8M6S0_9HYPO|nr:hypothetical protein MHUMG1_08180 [Metarhizium humberi]